MDDVLTRAADARGRHYDEFALSQEFAFEQDMRALGVTIAQHLYPEGVGTASGVFLSSMTLGAAAGGLIGGLGVVRGLSQVNLHWMKYMVMTGLPIDLQPGDVVKGGGNRQGGRLAFPDVDPDLEPVPAQRVEDLGDTRLKVAPAGGELLALGSLLLEGRPVRLVGQDTRRGISTV